MIQAEIGGAARVDPGNGVQRPGFVIRDFTLPASADQAVRISSFRGCSNLVLVFTGYSAAIRALLEDVARHAQEFSEQETTVVAVVPHWPEEKEIIVSSSSLIHILHDKAHAAYRLSGAIDENGCPVPLLYLTDRFGEIVATHLAPSYPMSLRAAKSNRSSSS